MITKPKEINALKTITSYSSAIVTCLNSIAIVGSEISVFTLEARVLLNTLDTIGNIACGGNISEGI